MGNRAAEEVIWKVGNDVNAERLFPYHTTKLVGSRIEARWSARSCGNFKVSTTNHINVEKRELG